MELKDRHAFFFLEKEPKGKPKVNFIAYAKISSNKYIVVFDVGGGNVTTSQLKQQLSEFRNRYTLYDYEDYTANEMYHLFKSKVSTFFNPKWFHSKYQFIVTQLQITTHPKSFDSFFYLDALDNRPKVGVMAYKRHKSGYSVNFYESEKLSEFNIEEDIMKLSLSSLLKRMVCYRYTDYTPEKLYTIFKSQKVPAKYNLPWFEEQYDRIQKIKRS